MNEFILYMLKASLGILVFYIIYWALLRKETFFRANRLFLITSLLTSLILPFIGFSYTTYVSNVDAGNIFVELNKNFQSLSNLTSPTTTSNRGINWQNLLLTIYITGLIIFLLRLLWQCFELIILIGKQSIQNINGLSVVENSKYGLPFSFFHLVFINPQFHYGTDLTNILAHEKVHISENHWFDLFIVELFTVVFWFNPFVWLFERSIKENHEYMADEGVLAQGLSVGRYQAILINQIMGMQIIGITNNLNYSLNKKRMKMMTKMKTPRIRAYKMLWALPATALLLLAFAKPAYIMDSKTNIPNIQTLNSDDNSIKVEGNVVDEKGNPLQDASVVLYGTSVGTVTDQYGKFSIEMKKTDKIFISYIGFASLAKDFTSIEIKSNTSTIFILKKGIINLDIDKILQQGKPLEDQKTNVTLDSKKGDEEVYMVVEELPEYPGGKFALAQEISKSIQKAIQNSHTKGKVNVGFTIDINGDITNVQALEKDNEDAAKEAIVIVSGLKRWSPGKQRGKAVPVNYSIVINL